MPIVLSGLAKDFAGVVPANKYVAGLWRSTLPHSLLWHTRDFKSDDLEYIAPSWSWLSTGCAITPANRWAIMEKKSVATILHISTKYQDAYGPVESLEGILRRIQLSFLYETNVFKVSVVDHEGDNEGMRAIGSSWDEYYGDMRKLELDAPLGGPDLECFIIFITIQRSSDVRNRDTACLLLKRVSGEGSTFSRISTLILNALYALKMQYRLHVDVEEDDWKVIQKDIEVLQGQAIQAEKKETEKRGEGRSKATPNDATGDTTLNATRNHLQGPGALYQFDDVISHRVCFEKLSLQILTIV